MKLNSHLKKHLSLSYLTSCLNQERGASIVEMMASMAMVSTAMAGVGTLMMSYQLQNIRNEIKSGAVIAGEQVLEQLRQCSVNTLPNSGTTTIPANNAPTTSPCGSTITPLTFMGNKFYRAQITYCQNRSYCDSSTRQVQVQVFYENASIFQVETVYTAVQ